MFHQLTSHDSSTQCPHPLCISIYSTYTKPKVRSRRPEVELENSPALSRAFFLPPSPSWLTELFPCKPRKKHNKAHMTHRNNQHFHFQDLSPLHSCGIPHKEITRLIKSLTISVTSIYSVKTNF